MLAASEGGHEQRAECDGRDRDQHGKATPAGVLLNVTTTARRGTP